MLCNFIRRLSLKLNRSQEEDSTESWPLNAFYYHTDEGKGKQLSFFSWYLLEKALFMFFLVIFNGTEILLFTESHTSFLKVLTQGTKPSDSFISL